MEGMIMDEEQQAEALAAYEELKVELPTEPNDPEFQELLEQSVQRLDLSLDLSIMSSQPDPFATHKE